MLVCSSAPAAMVAHWKLDDGSPSTTVVDETGVNNGTLSGGPTWITPGQVGTGALSFDHVDDHVDCGNNTSVNITGTAITITAWVYPVSYYAPGNWILGKMGNTTGSYGLFLSAGGNLVLGLDSGTGWADSNPSSTIVPLNQWHHVAVTYSGSNVRYYVDGQPAGTVSRPGSIVGKDHNLMIGYESGWSSQRWHGSLDDISLWNEVLDAAAILDIYNNGVQVAVTTAIDASNLNYVIVSPQGPSDGGSFGPDTAGTQTGGFEEAFEYAIDNNKEIFIVGGPNVTYNIQKQLVIPPAENLHVDGGNYVMNFTQTTGDCLVIDSGKNCKYKFGDVQAPNLQNGSLVRVLPQNPHPDDVISFEKSTLKLGMLTGPSNVGSVAGFEQDGTIGNEIFINKIENCGTGLLVTNGDADSIECRYIKNCATMLQVESGSGMQITCSLDPAGMAGLPIGANLLGGNNAIYNLTYLADFAAGDALVLGNSLQDNLIYALDLPNDGITDNANVKTNRIITTNAVGFDITTPAVAATGTYVENDTAFTVVVLVLTEGSVSSWSIKDSDGNIATVSAGLYAGQSMLLDPGDSIRFNYSSAPTWAWRAIR